jgi:hypothetical protein
MQRGRVLRRLDRPTDDDLRTNANSRRSLIQRNTHTTPPPRLARPNSVCVQPTPHPPTPRSPPPETHREAGRQTADRMLRIPRPSSSSTAMEVDAAVGGRGGGGRGVGGFGAKEAYHYYHGHDEEERSEEDYYDEDGEEEYDDDDPLAGVAELGTLPLGEVLLRAAPLLGQEDTRLPAAFALLERLKVGGWTGRIESFGLLLPPLLLLACLSCWVSARLINQPINRSIDPSIQSIQSTDRAIPSNRAPWNQSTDPPCAPFHPFRPTPKSSSDAGPRR